MGFKGLFKRKKKNRRGNASSNAGTPMSSRSSSINSRAQMEAELEQVFKKFDVNGDGKICAAELGAIMGSLGNPVTDEELKIMIEEVDSDGDGFIDLKEFIELNTSEMGNAEVLATLKDAFEVFDADKSGTICAKELLNVLKSLGEDCSLAECEKMISGVDKDGSGEITFDEFHEMMMKGSRNEPTESVQVGN